MRVLSAPDYYHQLGSNQHLSILQLLNQGIGAGAIISPRDVNRSAWKKVNLRTVSEQYRKSERRFLIDPQMYDPDEIEIQDDVLLGNTKGIANYPDIKPFIVETLEMQSGLGVSELIVPGTFTQAVSEEWFDVLTRFNAEAVTWRGKLPERKSLMATIAVHSSQIRNTEIRQRILNQLVTIDVDGFYLVVSDVSPQTVDVEFLIGFLDFVFRLKWREKKVLLGYSGLWAMLGFPFGLDAFASSGIKNRQSFNHQEFRGKRDGRQVNGWGNKKYNDLWSSSIMGYIRYPDDVERLSEHEFHTLFGSKSPYAPPIDQSPRFVHDTKMWQRGTSQNDYSWKMWEIAREFEGTSYETRIANVRSRLQSASENQRLLSGRAIRSSLNYIDQWIEAFETYLSAEVLQDLHYMNS